MNKLPTVIDGMPYCNENICPAFDGKRCKILGHRPGNLCEPAVRDMLETIADLRDRLAPMVCEDCGCALSDGEMWRDADFCEDCYAVDYGEIPDERAAACISVGLRALCGKSILEGVR